MQDAKVGFKKLNDESFIRLKNNINLKQSPSNKNTKNKNKQGKRKAGKQCYTITQICRLTFVTRKMR